MGMMKKILFFLDVLYYHCHLLYKSLLNQVSPSIQPSLMLGALVGYPLAAFFDNLYIYTFCEVPSAWFFFMCGLSIMFLIFSIYEVKDRKKKVIKNTPNFFRSKTLNLATIVIIVTIAIFFFYMGGPLGKNLLEQCE